VVIAKSGEPTPEQGPLTKPIVIGSHVGEWDIDYERAFGDEADAEVAAMFDDDIWPVEERQS